jgi:hypothetical protein
MVKMGVSNRQQPWRAPRHHHPGATKRRSPPVWTSSPIAGRGGLCTLVRLLLMFPLDPSLPPDRPCLAPCLKCFSCFQLMFQVFHLSVAKVDLRCCICCNGNICMLQAYVSSISGVSDILFQMFHLDVSKFDLLLHMLQGYTRMFQMLHLFLDICSKCFI